VWRFLGRLVPVLLLIVLGVAAPALAHVNLVDSDPDDGAVLAVSPGEVTFTFDDPVETLPGGVRLFDAGGRQLESSARAEDSVLTVDIPDSLDAGTYVVGWRVVSIDGHPIAGVLTFSIGTPSARVVQPELGATERAWLTATLSVVDGLTYLGLLVGVGAAVCAVWIVPLRGGARARSRLAYVVTAGAVLGLAAALLRVPLVTADQQGLGAGALIEPATWGSAPDEVVLGAALLLLGLGIVQAALTARWAQRWQKPVVVAGAVVALAGPTTTGHTRSLDPPLLVALVDMWHLLAASVWVGGVLGLALVWPRLHPDVRAAALSRFSTLAAAVLVVLVPSGALMGLRIVETTGALFGSGHGRLLLAKVALVVLAVLLALVNRRLARRQVPGATLGRTLALEAAVLVAVVAVVGAMVNQSPRPRPAEPRPVGGVWVSAELGTEVEALVSLSPGAVGDNVVRVVLRDGSGNTVEVSRPPRVRLAGPSGDEVQATSLVLADDGSFGGEVRVPAAGEWVLRVSQEFDEFTHPVAEVEVTITP
jgi:copper transport protein